MNENAFQFICLLKWDDDTKLIEIMAMSTLIFWIIVFNLVICEAGQRTTDQFDQFNKEFAQCNWNNLTVEMRRMYLILLSDTQQPKNVQSYGGILCIRETFKTVF